MAQPALLVQSVQPVPMELLVRVARPVLMERLARPVLMERLARPARPVPMVR